MVERLGPPDNSAQERLYGPKDVFLVMDTSFLIRLANRDLWANSVWHSIRRKAEINGKKFHFFMSDAVVNEYERMLQEDRRDEYGIPFVHSPLETMLGWQLAAIPISLDPSANQAAREAWQAYTSTHYPPQSHKVRKGPSETDISITAWTRTIASQGAEAYVASTDFRDVINPLIHDSENIVKDGLKITPMPPVPLQTESVKKLYCYKGNNGHLSPMINHALVADLQIARLHLGAFTYVVFEKGVKSGNTIFDVAVDVVELANLKGADRFKQNAGKFYAIPAIRLPHNHLNVNENVGTMRKYFGRSNPGLPYRLMVVDSGDDRFFPVLISPAGANSGWWRWHHPLHTTSDFLYHQTDSAYAKRYFRPNTRAAKSHRN